jgi:transaldolase
MNLPIEIYYDGTDILNYSQMPDITGFTTNISFLKKKGITDYNKYITDTLKLTGDKPISFQIFVDNHDDIEKQARHINSFGKSIYVKIPIVNTKGESNLPIIIKLLEDHIKVNITAVFSLTQVNEFFSEIWKKKFVFTTDCIISIFSGRISDTGVDPKDLCKTTKELFKDYNNVKILWAGCKGVFNVFEAIKSGCHIVTAPESVIDRMHRVGKDLNGQSVDTVTGFYNDGKELFFNY